MSSIAALVTPHTDGTKSINGKKKNLIEIPEDIDVIQMTSYSSTTNHDTPGSIPYISVDGRKKRRRTTVEDAFKNLSLQHSDKYNSITPSQVPDIPFLRTSLKADNDLDHSTFHIERCKQQTSGEQSFQTDDYDPFIIKSNLSSIDHLNNIDEDDYDCDSSFYSYTNPHDSHEFMSNDDSYCANHSSSTPEKRNQTHQQNDLNDTNILYAPTKESKPHTLSTNTINNRASKNRCQDPVDARIEELIRHSRIKAMIQTSKKNDAQYQQNNNFLNHQNTLQMMYNQQKKEKDIDCGGVILRRKNTFTDDSTTTNSNNMDTDISDIDIQSKNIIGTKTSYSQNSYPNTPTAKERTGRTRESPMMRKNSLNAMDTASSSNSVSSAGSYGRCKSIPRRMKFNYTEKFSSFGSDTTPDMKMTDL
jgi:hypothetical protein